MTGEGREGRLREHAKKKNKNKRITKTRTRIKIKLRSRRRMRMRRGGKLRTRKSNKENKVARTSCLSD